MDIQKLDKLGELYPVMLTARLFDEAQIAFYKSGQEHLEAVHSYIGQEAVGVGAGAAMTKDDMLVPSLRSRPAFFALNIPLVMQWSGALGRADNPGSGIVGSRHMAALDMGIVGTTGIVGAQIPLALGVAMAMQQRGEDRAVVCLFGDGAANRGDCHEAMNMAAVYKAPVVFLCEANGVAETQDWDSYMPIRDLSVRASAYGMPGARLDGTDPVAVFEATHEALARARAGEGPSFLVAECCRLRGHVEGLPDFRTQDYMATWREKDPIAIAEAALVEAGYHTRSDLNRIRTDISNRIDTALDQARAETTLSAPDLASLVEYTVKEIA